MICHYVRYGRVNAGQYAPYPASNSYNPALYPNQPVYLPNQYMTPQQYNQQLVPQSVGSSFDVDQSGRGVPGKSAQKKKNGKGRGGESFDVDRFLSFF